MLKLIRGEEVTFGSFGSDIRHRFELAHVLEAQIPPVNPAWIGIQRADNPEACLNTSMRQKLLEYDETYASCKAEQEAGDDEQEDGDEDFRDYADEDDNE